MQVLDYPEKETAVVKVERPLLPADTIAEGTAQAKALTDLIEKQKLYVTISGRKYVKVEGWVPLARMNGVIPREVSNEEKPDGKYVAKVQLVRISDGMILTEASGECGGPEEEMWQKRPPYARRSMAATRATGKACRLAYSWIIALGGYEPTPAEEMSEEIVKEERPKGSWSEESHNQEANKPDTTWRFTSKKGKPTIGINEGKKFTPEYLQIIGAREWPKGSKTWYLDDVQDNFKRLEEAKNAVL